MLVTRHHILDDQNVNHHCRANAKFDTLLPFIFIILNNLWPLFNTKDVHVTV